MYLRKSQINFGGKFEFRSYLSYYNVSQWGLSISAFVTRRVSSQIKVISIGKNYNGFFWQVQNQVVQRSSFNHCHSSRLFFFRNLLKFINGKRNTCYKASLMCLLGWGISTLGVKKWFTFWPKCQNPQWLFFYVNRYAASSLKMTKFGFSRSIYCVKNDPDIFEKIISWKEYLIRRTTFLSTYE